jgi:hypothetical protein
MVHVKYTRAMLSEAVTASTSMAGVLRHHRGTHSLNRRSADQILILRPTTANWAKPPTLRRALMEIGRSYLCGKCGIGDNWLGRPLVLHVDHIDGRLWARADLRTMEKRTAAAKEVKRQATV